MKLYCRLLHSEVVAIGNYLIFARAINNFCGIKLRMKLSDIFV